MTRRPRTDSPATDFSVALLEEFVRLGVRDIVLGPGSRSQALALAAAELERIGAVRLRVRIDERVGGYLAIGLAIETGTPVILITTSGTAVANLHPAVLEAHHSGVPLIVITADRPESLRGVGSNQTTDQPGIFGFAVRRSWDVGAPTGADGELDAAAELARDAFAAASRPVHLNLAFAEPLSAPITLDPAPPFADQELAPPPAASVFADQELRADTPAAPAEQRRVAPDFLNRESSRFLNRESGGFLNREGVGDAAVLKPGVGTVVVAGTGAGERAEELARELGAPLFAEVASGAHFGPNLVVAYRELLRTPGFGDSVERVVVLGHPTLSRELPALIQREGVNTIVVRGRGADDYNPGRRVSEFVEAVRVAGEPAPREWAGRWVGASRALLESDERGPDIDAELGAHVRGEFEAVRRPLTRRDLVEAVWKATWPHDRLVLAASRLIREADRFVPGKRIRVHANRGLAGIDGNIATGLGMALASQDGQSSGTTRVLLGDLALLHDVGALLFGAGEPRPRIQVIVGNDGGGTIFDGLEVASTAGAAFDRVLLTRQEFDLEPLARAYGWDYLLVESRGAIDQALTAAVRPTIIEVPLPR